MNGLKSNVTRKKNAVCAKITDVDDIQDALNDVNYYLLVNKLHPVASPYLVRTKEAGVSCIEIYIDICGET